ncbi:hypothetical protein HU200_049231 [Digitaria exilis]|uniref:EGF-like domain-containing protein n=1 Tax=Digitaria exilis TaxID=1010633 RepID=A0A835B065_9POAL|nr:hypothetical protein HU200_049231 [Digitaria exilis]
MCDTAKCGRGRCSEVQGPITTYKCTCDPGWSQPSLLNLTLDFAPCIIPHCTFDSSCYNVSLLPKAIPLPPDIDPCVAVNCGPGECKRGEGLSYSCKCQDGYVNFLNSTSFPCVKNCVFGMDCSKLGIGPPSPPPPPSTAPLPPPGNHDSPAPPNGPKGNAPSLLGRPHKNRSINNYIYVLVLDSHTIRPACATAMRRVLVVLYISISP